MGNNNSKLLYFQPFSLKQISGCVLYQNLVNTLYCASEGYVDFCFCDMYQGCSKKYYNGKIFACELCQLVEDFIPGYYSKNKYHTKLLINQSIELISRLKKINEIVNRDLISELSYKYLFFYRSYPSGQISSHSIFDVVTPDHFRF